MCLNTITVRCGLCMSTQCVCYLMIYLKQRICYSMTDSFPSLLRARHRCWCGLYSHAINELKVANSQEFAGIAPEMIYGMMQNFTNVNCEWRPPCKQLHIPVNNTLYALKLGIKISLTFATLSLLASDSWETSTLHSGIKGECNIWTLCLFNLFELYL